MHISIDGATWLFDGRPDLPEVLVGFQPDANTDQFIARMPDYVAHGVDAFTISLQGGTPGYEGAVNSAFNANGTLRDAYLKRVSRVIRTADANGCAIILSCFYQRQHSHTRALGDRASIHAAVTNTARWVASQGFTQVILEIANEYAHAGFAHWPAGAWLRSHAAQVELIHATKTAALNLLVSTSGMGSGATFGPVAHAGDFTIIHFNNTETDAIPERIAASKTYGKPVVCNEDDKVGPVGAEAARLSIISGAGWGFMHSAQNQSAPFQFAGRDDDPYVYGALARLTSPGYNPGDSAVSPAFVLITDPKDGDTFSPNNPVTVRATLSGCRSIQGTRVQFFADDLLIGEADSAPWHVRWQRVPPGTYNLVAVVLDNAGTEHIRSRPVDIVVA
jgi:hypothetical protein